MFLFYFYEILPVSDNNSNECQISRYQFMGGLHKGVRFLIVDQIGLKGDLNWIITIMDLGALEV